MEPCRVHIRILCPSVSLCAWRNLRTNEWIFSKFDTVGIGLKWGDHFSSFGWIILTNTMRTYSISDTFQRLNIYGLKKIFWTSFSKVYYIIFCTVCIKFVFFFNTWHCRNKGRDLFLRNKELRLEFSKCELLFAGLSFHVNYIM